MGEHDVSNSRDEEQLRTFMRALLDDVHALEKMLDDGLFETGVRRIGAEQEMFLVDSAGRPWCGAEQMLKRLNDPMFTNELAQFNLEANLLPHLFGDRCLNTMESELRAKLDAARDAAKAEGGAILLTGILPTLELKNLGLESMTDNPRYRALNDAIVRLRGGSLRFKIKGVDELDAIHDNVMLESCNTSFQIHFQVGPEEFAKLYNVAQAITAPVLACAVNSPLLLGKRLWKETRVALFQQSVDARSDAHQKRGQRPRVSFGDHWLNDSVLEIFREDIARFRVVMQAEADENPMDVLERGDLPELTALRVHNGTVYRWNRACYGVHEGVAHLRIENRVLPAGPTVLDEVGNAALFFGLMCGLADEVPNLTERMRFDDAKVSFFAAARHGLKATMTWLDGKEWPVCDLLREELIPMARRGLVQHGIAKADVDRYLGVIEDRVKAGTTGSTWALRSLEGMGDEGSTDQRMRALVDCAIAKQRTGEPVHKWDLATLNEGDGWRHSYMEVGQFMTTDVFTVRPEDVVDLAASLMDWRHVRHVPVEDDNGCLVGLVSHRTLLRLLGKGAQRDGQAKPVPVKDIMKRDPVSATPGMPTLQAIELMRQNKVGCLPVVDGELLVGIITERDLIRVAGMLFEAHLRDAPTP